MGLCKECQQQFNGIVNKTCNVPLNPWIHCHHDMDKPKEKCWCETKENLEWNHIIWNVETHKHIKPIFCPVCGRKL
jgi:hypothetical protein